MTNAERDKILDDLRKLTTARDRAVNPNEATVRAEQLEDHEEAVQGDSRRFPSAPYCGFLIQASDTAAKLGERLDTLREARLQLGLMLDTLTSPMMFAPTPTV